MKLIFVDWQKWLWVCHGFELQKQTHTYKPKNRFRRYFFRLLLLFGVLCKLKNSEIGTLAVVDKTMPALQDVVHKCTDENCDDFYFSVVSLRSFFFHSRRYRTSEIKFYDTKDQLENEHVLQRHFTFYISTSSFLFDCSFVSRFASFSLLFLSLHSSFGILCCSCISTQQNLSRPFAFVRWLWMIILSFGFFCSCRIFRHNQLGYRCVVVSEICLSVATRK